MLSTTVASPVPPTASHAPPPPVPAAKIAITSLAISVSSVPLDVNDAVPLAIASSAAKASVCPHPLASPSEADGSPPQSLPQEESWPAPLGVSSVASTSATRSGALLPPRDTPFPGVGFASAPPFARLVAESRIRQPIHTRPARLAMKALCSQAGLVLHAQMWEH